MLHQTRIIVLVDKLGNGGNVMRNVEHNCLKSFRESRKRLEVYYADFKC